MKKNILNKGDFAIIISNKLSGCKFHFIPIGYIVQIQKTSIDLPNKIVVKGLTDFFGKEDNELIEQTVLTQYLHLLK